MQKVLIDENELLDLRKKADTLDKIETYWRAQDLLNAAIKKRRFKKKKDKPNASNTTEG